MLIDVFVTLLLIIASPLRLSTFDGGALAQVSVLLNLKLLACKPHIRSIDHSHTCRRLSWMPSPPIASCRHLASLLRSRTRSSFTRVALIFLGIVTGCAGKRAGCADLSLPFAASIGACTEAGLTELCSHLSNDLQSRNEQGDISLRHST